MAAFLSLLRATFSRLPFSRLARQGLPTSSPVSVPPGTSALSNIKPLLRSELRHNPSLLLLVEHALDQLDKLQWEKRELCSYHKELQRNHKELIASKELELLRCRGLNNTRGLFETLQQRLVERLGLPPGLKGLDLWQTILRMDPQFRTCVQNATGLNDIVRQAAEIYGIYRVLSQHAHAGKDLRELVSKDGVLRFQRGPLSPENANVFRCMGVRAGLLVDEDEDSKARLF